MVDDYTGPGWTGIAASVLRTSLGLRRGQSVMIETWDHSLRAAEIIAVEARRLGIRPFIVHASYWAFFESQRRATPWDANALSSIELAAAAASDGYIVLPDSLEHYARRDHLPSANRRANQRRRQEWNSTLVRHSVPSVNLLAALVTSSSARELGVDFTAWQREAFGACQVSPRLLRREARPIARQLARGKRITITHPNGTHLELGLARRQPVLDVGAVDRRDLAAGRFGTNVPGGYLAVAVDEHVAEGMFLSNRPTRSRRGVIEEIRWTFRDGRLHHYDVGAGGDVFRESYDRAGRERDRPAILEIGLNPAIRDFPLAEDQERGVVTV